MNNTILERMKSILCQLFEIFGQQLAHLANHFQFIEQLFMAILKGFQNTLSTDRLIGLMNYR